MNTGWAAAAVALAGILLAAVTYLGLERLGRRAWLPMGCRAVAWTALGLLLLDVSCPAPTAVGRPIVLLDASRSMVAPGGAWAAASDSARNWGEVRPFGDDRPFADTLPDRGASRLARALAAAVAGDRPVIVVTDGEIGDRADIPPADLGRARVRLFPRAARPDLAMVDASGPGQIGAADTLRLTGAVQAFGGIRRDSVTLEAWLGGRRLARRRVSLHGTDRIELTIPPGALPAGQQVLRFGMADAADPDSLTDWRLLAVNVVATPGVVLLASPGDWESRFLFRALTDVAQLPVRGYVKLEPTRWRAMNTLAPVSDRDVRRAAAGADLLIERGDPGKVVAGIHPHGLWRWPGPSGAPTTLAGDWYLSSAPPSPLATAFEGALDTLPPVTRILPGEPDAQWTGATAKLGRHGAARPVIYGRIAGGRREVTFAADGLWRWAFQGGAPEQTYRAMVAATVSWLLGGADSARGEARPADPVVTAGRPVIFRWVAGGSAAALPIHWGDSAGASDTLRFDGSGRAEVWLPVGIHRYRLANGGRGLAVVEPYSDEYLPRPVALGAQDATVTPATRRSQARDWIWLFGICIAGLSAEWLVRRRMGLR